jgi:hypothetical protein
MKQVPVIGGPEKVRLFEKKVFFIYISSQEQLQKMQMD